MSKTYKRKPKIKSTPATIEKRLRYLRWEVLRSQYEYYVLSEPRRTDSEFDEMFRVLVDLEMEQAGGDERNIPSDSPAVRVGSSIASDYPWHVRINRPPWWSPNLVRVYNRDAKVVDLRFVGLDGQRRMIYA